MKTHLSIFMMILVCFINSMAYSGDKFAPVAEIPAGLEKDQNPAVALLIHSIKAVKVPDSATIGLPAYPKSVVIQTNKGSDDLLPSLRLLSTDSLSQVFVFYKKDLDNWSHDEFFGTYTLWFRIATLLATFSLRLY